MRHYIIAAFAALALVAFVAPATAQPPKSAKDALLAPPPPRDTKPSPTNTPATPATPVQPARAGGGGGGGGKVIKDLTIRVEALEEVAGKFEDIASKAPGDNSMLWVILTLVSLALASIGLILGILAMERARMAIAALAEHRKREHKPPLGG